MCKVAGVTKITDKNRQDVWFFMMVLGEFMTQGNDDGLGYAAFDKSGNLFGERWLINKTAFTDLSGHKGMTAERMSKIYNFFGEKVLRDEAQAIVLHTRFATCSKGLKNTHPFINDIDNPKSAIIHNGIIANDHDFQKKYSTCDSEVIVHLYEDHKISQDFEQIKSIAEKLMGWFTVLALSKDAKDRPVMDVFSDTGRLESYYIPDLGTRVYSTSGQDIVKTAKIFGLKLEDNQKVKPNSAIRVDVKTGDVVSHLKFKPFDWTSEGSSGNLYKMDGNFDDEDFFTSFFKRGNNA